MSSSNSDRIEMLAALHAAGAATPAEHQELEALRAESAEAAALVRGFEDAATALALDLTPVEPPAGALESLRQRIRAEQAAGTVSPSDGERARQPGGPGPHERDDHGAAAVISLSERRARRRWVDAAAALAAVAALALGALWVRERRGAEELRQRLSEADATSEKLQDALADARQRAGYIRSPSLELATLRVSTQPSAPKAKIFIDADNRRWLVLAYDLPAIDPNEQDYQLWFIPAIEGATPMPAGLLVQRDDGVFEAEVTLPEGVDVGQAAISLEKKGGVQVPTDVKMAGPVL
ncbi:anti-sigma factor domain-containing protein [Haliangium sp.]|uniref:anti-sigma factor domain-containing protein n=1 Tax=Haliangium sp. TaxID=2663208 RepID=UPI003D0C33DF